MNTRDIFDMERLPPGLTEILYDTNPWWSGKPSKPTPKFKRWAFNITRKKLNSGLAPIVVLRGPRQVGKTTLQLQLIEEYLKQGVHPSQILRVQFDEISSLAKLSEPILSITRWFENRILKTSFNEAARKNKPAYLFFDEVQNLAQWAPQLKTLVDNHSVKILVTGSSALRIAAGKDSLAGRIATLDIGTLLVREIAELRFGEIFNPYLPYNGLDPLLKIDFWKGLQHHGLKIKLIRDKAFKAFSERGGYPMVHANSELEWPQVADQLNETIVQRAIEHDLRIGVRGQKRDASLLKEVFGLACRYAGQTPGKGLFLQEMKEAMHANIGWQRISAYLQFLEQSLLIKKIEPLEIRLKRKKGNSKICICDHGLRASWLHEVIPIDPGDIRKTPHLSDLAGHIAESITGYFLAGLPHLTINHFPERSTEPEVDFILTLGEYRIPVEVKYRQKIDPHRDTVGLRAFLEKTVYNAPFGILVTMNDQEKVTDPRIIALPLSSLLLLQ